MSLFAGLALLLQIARLLPLLALPASIKNGVVGARGHRYLKQEVGHVGRKGPKIKRTVTS